MEESMDGFRYVMEACKEDPDLALAVSYLYKAGRIRLYENNHDELFVTLFQIIKDLFKNKPEKIEKLNKIEISLETVVNIMLLFTTGEIIQEKWERTLTKLSQSTPIFQKMWKQYTSSYENRIAKILSHLEKIIDQTLKSKLEEYGSSIGEMIGIQGGAFWSFTGDGLSFRPLSESSIESDNITKYLKKYFGTLDEDDITRVDLDFIIGGYTFVTENIGVDLDAIYSKHKKIEYLVVSPQMTQKTLQSLYMLYNEAVRTYVMGCNIACMTMCRALWELILKNYYLDIQDDREKLGKIISMAERKFSRLTKLNLKSSKEEIDKLLHGFDGKEVEDGIVLNNLTTTKFLIENINAIE